MDVEGVGTSRGDRVRFDDGAALQAASGSATGCNYVMSQTVPTQHGAVFSMWTMLALCN